MRLLNAMRQLCRGRCWRLDADSEQRRTEQVQRDIRAQESRVMQVFHLAETRLEQRATLGDTYPHPAEDSYETTLHALHLAHERTREQQERTAHLRLCHKPRKRDNAPVGWPMLSFEQLQIVRRNAVDAKTDLMPHYSEQGRSLDQKLRLDAAARDSFLRVYDRHEAEMPSRLGVRNYPWARELALATLT